LQLILGIFGYGPEQSGTMSEPLLDTQVVRAIQEVKAIRVTLVVKVLAIQEVKAMLDLLAVRG
jgi:hypothetical protein